VGKGAAARKRTDALKHEGKNEAVRHPMYQNSDPETRTVKEKTVRKRRAIRGEKKGPNTILVFGLMKCSTNHEKGEETGRHPRVLVGRENQRRESRRLQKMCGNVWGSDHNA